MPFGFARRLSHRQPRRAHLRKQASFAEALALLLFALLYAPFVVVDVLKRSQAESS